MNVGIENSRRFRALPVYATLVAYGHEGYREMLARQVSLSRKIAELLFSHPDYVLLPESTLPIQETLEDIFMIVLFRAKDDDLNKDLMNRINSTLKIFVSGTEWDGKPAARFAVSNWQVDVAKDLATIEGVLNEVAQSWKTGKVS
jgi:glutamate/tyrosine decarboxylase-like PLP-dependent enzyme